MPAPRQDAGRRAASLREPPLPDQPRCRGTSPHRDVDERGPWYRRRPCARSMEATPGEGVSDGLREAATSTEPRAAQSAGPDRARGPLREDEPAGALAGVV